MESSEHQRETICPTRLVVGLLDVFLSEYPDESHNFTNVIFFMTSHFRTLFRILILPTSDYSQTPPYGHPLKTNTGSLLRTAQFALSLEKESLTFSLNSSRLIQTPR